MTSTAQRGLIKIIKGTAVSVWAGLKGTGQKEEAPGLLTVVPGLGTRGRLLPGRRCRADPVPSPSLSPAGHLITSQGRGRGTELPGRPHAGQREGHTGQRGEEPSTRE